MGKNLSSLVGALNCPKICSDCSKYVFNSMTVHSECSECCKFDIETHEVELSDDDSQVSFEVNECCLYRSHK